MCSSTLDGNTSGYATIHSTTTYCPCLEQNRLPVWALGQGHFDARFFLGFAQPVRFAWHDLHVVREKKVHQTFSTVRHTPHNPAFATVSSRLQRCRFWTNVRYMASNDQLPPIHPDRADAIFPPRIVINATIPDISALSEAERHVLSDQTQYEFRFHSFQDLVADVKVLTQKGGTGCRYQPPVRASYDLNFFFLLTRQTIGSSRDSLRSLSILTTQPIPRKPMGSKNGPAKPSKGAGCPLPTHLILSFPCVLSQRHMILFHTGNISLGPVRSC